MLSAPGRRLRELGAVDRCTSEPSKRGRRVAKDPQWSLRKYFGIELLGFLVEFIGRRDYGDPTHQLVDLVASDPGSERDKIVFAWLKLTASSHMKDFAKRQRGRCRQFIWIAVKIPLGEYPSKGVRMSTLLDCHRIALIRQQYAMDSTGSNASRNRKDANSAGR